MRNKYLIPGKLRAGDLLLEFVQRPRRGGWYAQVRWRYDTPLCVPAGAVAVTGICSTQAECLRRAKEWLV